MSGNIRDATAALEKAIRAALPSAARPYVSVGRPGWSWRDLLGNRVNIYLVQISEDRGRSNELLPSRPNVRALSMTYMITFYGRTVEDQLQALMEALVRRPGLVADEGANATGGLSTGLTAVVLNYSLDDLVNIWGLFRRKYALSMLIEVKGGIVSAD